MRASEQLKLIREKQQADFRFFTLKREIKEKQEIIKAKREFLSEVKTCLVVVNEVEKQFYDLYSSNDYLTSINNLKELMTALKTKAKEFNLDAASLDLGLTNADNLIDQQYKLSKHCHDNYLNPMITKLNEFKSQLEAHCTQESKALWYPSQTSNP